MSPSNRFNRFTGLNLALSLGLVSMISLAPQLRADVLFVPAGTADVIKRVGSSGLVSDYTANIIDGAGAVVFDASGAAYVSSVTAGKILMISPSGVASDFSTGLVNPTGLALDASGILYAAVGTGVVGESKILKFDTGAGSGNLFVNLPTNSDPKGLAFGTNGHLFVAQKGLNQISEITPAGAISIYSSTSGQPSGQTVAPVALAFDAAGTTLYLTDTQDGGRVATIGGSGRARTFQGSLGTNLRGLALDAAGAAYVASGATNVVTKIVPISGANNSVADFATVADPGFLAIRGVDRSVVVKKGDPAETDTNPLNALNAAFSTYGLPATGYGGETAFRGTVLAGVNGITTLDNLGIWVIDAAGVQKLVARKNFAADGTNGALWSGFSDPVLSPAGSVAFRGLLKAGGTDGLAGTLTGLWYGVPGTPLKVVRQGSPAPGTGNGGKFLAFSSFALSNAGLIFTASVVGPEVTAPNNTGIWIVDNDQVKLLVREHAELSAAKFLTSFTMFKTVPYAGATTRSFNSAGAVSYLGKFSDTLTGVVNSSLTGTSIVLQKNSPAEIDADPNNLPGKFLSFGAPAVNASGQNAFRAVMASGTVPGANGVNSIDSAGIWVVDSNAVQHLVARKNFVAQGTQNAVWSNFSDPVLNDSGEVAFRGLLKAGVGDGVTGKLIGIWSGAPSALSAIRQGDPAPGCGTGVKFAGFTTLGLSDNGVIFTGRVVGSGVVAGNDTGIWAVDPDGVLQLLQREGAKVSVDGVAKALLGFTLLKPVLFAPGQTRSFDSANSVVYLAKFSDATTAILRASFP